MQCTRRETVDAVGMLIINPEGTVQVGDHLCLPSCPGEWVGSPVGWREGLYEWVGGTL